MLIKVITQLFDLRKLATTVFKKALLKPLS